MAKKNKGQDNAPFPAFPQRGVLTKLDDPQYAQAVQSAYSTPDNLVVYMPGISAINMPTTDLTQDQNTGRLSFISSNTPYRIREIREDDGEWLSKYKTLLPQEAIHGLIGQPNFGDDNEMLDDTDLSNPDESIDAFSTDDSAYILGVVYTNDAGRWVRQDGDWIQMSPADNTFQGMVVTPIDPEKASDFLEMYDNNFVTVSDASAFEAENDDDDTDYSSLPVDTSSGLNPDAAVTIPEEDDSDPEDQPEADEDE